MRNRLTVIQFLIHVFVTCYANEVGEAFRSIVPNSVVRLSYVIASGYVLADTINSGLKAYRKDVTPGRTKNALMGMTDTLLWQSFASVIIPGFTINRICATVQFLQKRSNNVALRNKWIPTAIGLASIPLIIRPIDNMVEDVMNVTYRKWVGYHPKHS
ncbi:mitochondrial fission process protein 1 isoform X2 [Ceratina calcarata]|uniref:Mitochondrial fission process protein 1 n=1 Tax=Ceratina calcarata TaxID=156304 RepID=A0AAJ7N484_9HYME|nr:mitochondrial fission process protein 1 isoform X2 [Ceratina calcarata]